MLSRDIEIFRTVMTPFSERVEFAALTVWPAGAPLPSFVRALLATMRKRLETDMEALRASMPPAARKVMLHQFQRSQD